MLQVLPDLINQNVRPIRFRQRVYSW